MLPAASWALPLVGLAALYLPTYLAAARSIWQTDDHAHGPLVLAVAAWLFWTSRRALAAAAAAPRPWLGSALLLPGLVLYLFGRAIDSPVLVLGSQPMVVAGCLLCLKGPAALKACGFAVFYLVFMVPLPSLLVDAATQPLKHSISVIAETLLHTAGYPVARSGVIISIGQYQMLVADACSGLHSMFSLAALGTLFMYLVGRTSWLHNAVMLASIVPIAFVANIVRVMILLLVTFHLGDEAGQGLLHGAAGMLLMLTALLGFVALDAALGAMGCRPAAAGASGVAR